MAEATRKPIVPRSVDSTQQAGGYSFVVFPSHINRPPPNRAITTIPMTYPIIDLVDVVEDWIGANVAVGIRTVAGCVDWLAVSSTTVGEKTTLFFTNNFMPG